ncbi:ERMES complex subunit [Apophysomyces ossiformis]|uniref:Mitochondrial distribution and morphology protein 34 n=1 Tax=Apophysomyces ossiformis TaxID=679940 RepID=A0A8H7BY79_9FUNG|nr:ERMES complex subunit [Apophysomyces ossiformis]
MAFRFNWPEFGPEFYDEAKTLLENALNKGTKPANIVDHITVKELHMGTTPPDLEILEIGELTMDKFRGIFKLTYAGDAYIVLQTKVQANPMCTERPDLSRHTRPDILAADQPLVVPMLLRISDLRLRGIVVLVVSKTKGVTLVFKNDPLESIQISSTFDSIASIREFLQREIEKQLRQMLQEEIPVMIHNLSQRYLPKTTPGSNQQCAPSILEDDPSHIPTLTANSTYDAISEYQSQVSIPAAQPFLFEDDLSDIYLSKRLSHVSFAPYFDKGIAPVTMANLSHLNRHYGICPLYTEYACISTMHRHFQAYDPTDDELTEETMSLTSSFATYNDLYTEDDDMPWYATELSIVSEPSSLEQSYILYPNTNVFVKKLAQLTVMHHTASISTPVMQHVAFRSLPHSVRKTMPKHNKIPRRRTIRLTGVKMP